MEQPFLPFDEPNLWNDFIFMGLEYSDHFCHCFLNQVDSNTDLLDNGLLTKIIVQPTEKSRSVGPHKSKLEKNKQVKNKSCLKNKMFKNASAQKT